MIEKISLALDNMGMYLRDLGFIIYKPKYFRETPIKEKIKKFDLLLKKTKCQTKHISDEKLDVLSTYNSKTRISKIIFHTKYNKNKPSIIFHHGAGQFNYNIFLRKGLGERIWCNYNIFSIKAQHHENLKDYSLNCMNSFLNWQLTFVGSVQALEEIVKFHKNKSKKPIIAFGVSMGGIVSTLHFLKYNSADIYIPMIAYPDAGDIFLNYAYKFAVDNRQERIKNKTYFESFSFKNNFSEKNKGKVFPILARYDKYIDFKKASIFWKGYTLKIYDLGHRSIIIKLKDIQDYIEKIIKNKTNN